MSITDVLETVLAECGIDNTSPSINAATFEMRQIKALMNEAGRDINSRAEWSKALKSFTVNSGLSSGALPSDFQEMAEGGAVTIAGTEARPVVDPSMWSFLSADAPAATYYRLQGGSIHFLPALTANATVEYTSKNWLDGDKSGISTDTDAPIFPERLLARATIWRWKRQKGQAFDDLIAEFEADLEVAIKADRGLA